MFSFCSKLNVVHPVKSVRSLYALSVYTPSLGGQINRNASKHFMESSTITYFADDRSFSRHSQTNTPDAKHVNMPKPPHKYATAFSSAVWSQNIERITDSAEPI